MSTHLRPLACAALGAALLLSSCGSSDGTDTSSNPRVTPTATPTTTPTTTGSDASSPAASAGSDYTGPTIPAGLWTRHMTPDQAAANEQRLGLTRATVDTAVGTFSTDLAFSFKIEDGVWAQYQALDGGESTVEDSGTFTYDDQGNWSTLSHSPGCPDCVGIIGWSLDGGELTLTLQPGYDHDPVARFVTEGTYQLTS